MSCILTVQHVSRGQELTADVVAAQSVLGARVAGDAAGAAAIEVARAAADGQLLAGVGVQARVRRRAAQVPAGRLTRRTCNAQRVIGPAGMRRRVHVHALTSTSRTPSVRPCNRPTSRVHSPVVCSFIARWSCNNMGAGMPGRNFDIEAIHMPTNASQARPTLVRDHSARSPNEVQRSSMTVGMVRTRCEG